MRSTKRRLALISALATVVAMIGIGLGFASSATAAPYSNPATASGSTSTPSAGGTMTVSGNGMDPGETVNVVEHSDPVFLGSTKADSTGAWSLQVKLAAGLTGAHTLVATGQTSGKTATFAITVQAAGSGAASGSTGGGGLAATGVAVIGISALGLVLLVGGGLMLLAGRRRTRASV